jgi:hypothetical protein
MPFKSKNIDVRIIVGIAVALVFAIGALYLQSSPVSANSGAEPTATPKRKARPAPKRTNFGDFQHSEKAHQLECSNCHKFPSSNWKTVRPEKDAFPDITEYPKHQTCVNCHKQQFFKGTPPKICSICHVNPSPRDNPRHPYPNPREVFDLSPKGKTAQSDWVVGFPHDKHIEIVSQNREGSGIFRNASFVRAEGRAAGEASCTVCHQTMKPTVDPKVEYLVPPPPKLGSGFWLKRGTFKTAPIGHTKCFECHNADMGILPAPQSCASCHHLKPPAPAHDFDPKLAAAMIVNDKVMTDAWAKRESSGKYRHEFAAHVDLPCSTCHDVAKMNTADPATQKVAISSCAMCHATPSTGDGGALNAEMDGRKADAKFQCVKCHVTLGTLAVPKSHTDALTAATGE